MDRYPDIPAEEFELIERYLTGQLDAAGKAGFEARLVAEPALRAQTEEVRLLITGVREQGLKAAMQHFHQEMKMGTAAGGAGAAGAGASSSPGAGSNIKDASPSVSSGESNNESAVVVTKVRSMKRWLVAASVVALIGVAIWFAIRPAQHDNQLFQAYYEKDPGLLSAMGSVSDHYDFDRAMIDYKQGNNKAAARAWETQVLKQPANDTLNYFIGSAYLADGDATKAASYFTKVIERKTSAFLTEAYWYMGLAMIRQGKEKEALQYLQKSDRPERAQIIEAINKE